MFRSLPTFPSTQYLLAWLDEVVLTPERLRHAEEIIARLSSTSPEVAKLAHAPQSAPHHTEGPYISSHVERMLASVVALESMASLAEVEEIVREKNFHLEFQAVEATVREQANFLSAYAVLHDLAKAEAVCIEAPLGSPGHAAGFSQTIQGSTPAEQERFSKLFRSFAASHQGLAPWQLQIEFFNAYQLRIHYPHHGRLAATEKYAQARSSVMHFFNVSSSHARLMSELIRLHMDVIRSFTTAADTARYQMIVALPDRLGLNKELFLELIPATLFIDAVVGSLQSNGQVIFCDLSLLLNYFKAEREVAPQRHEARVQAALRGRKQAVKETLAEANLDAEVVFALLNTPHGPVRGKVMEDVYELIKNPDATVDFGSHTPEIKKRANMAKNLLAERNLQL